MNIPEQFGDLGGVFVFGLAEVGDFLDEPGALPVQAELGFDDPDIAPCFVDGFDHPREEPDPTEVDEGVRVQPSSKRKAAPAHPKVSRGLWS